MKKAWMLPLLAAACGCAAAQQQGGVELYGLVDAGIHHVTGLRGGSVTQLASGIMEGSRWGLRGQEDLGGGWRALFTLESRFEADTGALSNQAISGGQLPDRLSSAPLMGLPAAAQPAVSAVAAALGAQVGVNVVERNLFDRQAYAGLVTPVGALLAGRQYTPAYEVGATFDAMQAQSSLAAPQLATLPASFDIRVSNALQYRIQQGGLSAGVIVGAGEGQRTTGRFVGAQAIWKTDRLSLGIGWNQRDNELGERSLRSIVAGARAGIGPGEASVMVAKFDDDHPSGLSVLPAAVVGAFRNALVQDSRLWNLGYRLPFGPHTVTVAFSRMDDRRAANADTDSWGMAWTYALSRRTDLNLALAHYDNKGLGQAAPGGNGFLGGVTASAGKDANNLALGVRHRF